MARLVYVPTGLWATQAHYLDTRHARLLERGQGTSASARDARRDAEAMRPVPRCPHCAEPVSGHKRIGSNDCA